MFLGQYTIFGIVCLLQISLRQGAVIVKKPVKDGRIVGGEEISISYFPHQVSLRFRGTHICGGAILNATTIVTAAHCVSQSQQPLLYSIRAGSSEHERGGVLVNVKRIIPHPNYNRPTALNNDIALLFLAKPLNFSSNIEPIAVVSKNTPIKKNALLFVSGWGTTAMDKNDIVPRLRYTRIFLQDHAKCRITYQVSGAVTTAMLCAGIENGGRDSCQGDSGGPLVTYSDNKLKLIGVVSWGTGCGLTDFPGIYTNVAAFEDWIRTTIAKFK